MTDEPTSGVEAELRDQVRRLSALLDQQMGTPCEQIRHAQEIAALRGEAGGLEDEPEIHQRIRAFFANNIGATRTECATALGVDRRTVWKHLKRMAAASEPGAAAIRARAALATPAASPDDKVAQAIEDMNYFTSEVASNGICYVPQSRIAKWGQCLSALAAKNSSPSHPMKEPVAGWRRLTALELDDAFDRVYVDVVAARRARKGQP